jgi:hypothetical protein
VELPEYLFPAASDVDASIIDTDVIREVCEVCRVFLSSVISSVTETVLLMIETAVFHEHWLNLVVNC